MNVKSELLSVMGEFMETVASLPEEIDIKYSVLVRDAKENINRATESIECLKRGLMN